MRNMFGMDSPARAAIALKVRLDRKFGQTAFNREEE
jgi:hypothetical protein